MFLGPIFGHEYSLALFSFLVEFPEIEKQDVGDNVGDNFWILVTEIDKND